MIIMLRLLRRTPLLHWQKNNDNEYGEKISINGTQMMMMALALAQPGRWSSSINNQFNIRQNNQNIPSIIMTATTMTTTTLLLLVEHQLLPLMHHFSTIYLREVPAQELCIMLLALLDFHPSITNHSASLNNVVLKMYQIVS